MGLKLMPWIQATFTHVFFFVSLDDSFIFEVFVSELNIFGNVCGFLGR